MDYSKVAQDIIDHVGGKQNVKEVTHCFTRLRFVLKDPSKAEKETVEHLEGVISVVEAGGQFQVVCGAKVEKIYDAVTQILGTEISSDGGEKQGFGATFLQKITQIFTPLVPAIAAAGLIKGILAVCARVPGFDTEGSTYVILNTASNIIFYYMPIFLAYTGSKALKTNRVVSMILGAFLCHPTIDAMMQDVATKSTIFGLPVIKMAFTVGESTKIFAYTESVIPILLGLIVLHYLEKFLKKVTPEILQLILVPGLSLIIMIPVLLVVVGPVGIYVGYLIQKLYTALYNFSPVLGGIIVGGLWGVCVIFGAHRALLPIGLNDVAMTGTNTLMCFAGAANFAQAGAALGVMLKTKDKNLKQVAASASVSGWLVGITEPAIYGCNLRLKKPMVCAIIAGAAGGAVMGIGKAVNTGFANNGILTIMSYYGEGTSLSQFLAYLIGICVSFFGAAVLTYIIGFDDSDSSSSVIGDVDFGMGSVPQQKGTDTIAIVSPVEGKAYPLSEVQDEVFSSGAMGKGVAVLPTKGEVRAPEDAVVSVLYPTGHAIGLQLNSGAELLIHIGMDTVNLNGKGFTKHVKQGDRVKKGDLIVSFDIDTIKKAGLDTSVCLVVANTDNYKEIDGLPCEKADLNQTVIEIRQ
jgi:PTS system beta-glucosides-specific IIC component